MKIKTEIVKIDRSDPDIELLSRAAKILRKGGLVAFPTETVYGLGANALDQRAVSSIFAAKGRPQDNPLIVHIYDQSRLERIAVDIPPVAYELMNVFFPGPLTLVLKKHPDIPLAVSGGLDTVAVRQPDHPIAAELIRISGLPLAAPSANRSGRPSPTNAKAVIDDLYGRVDMIIDGGKTEIGLESTVLSLVASPPRLLRPGGVTVEQLRELIPDIIVDGSVISKPDDNQRPLSPGMKYKHYSPKAEVFILNGELSAFLQYVNLRNQKNKNIGIICFDEDIPYINISGVKVLSIGSINNSSEQAANLFEALRRMDDEGAAVIYSRTPDTKGLGLAVYNRLIRAAGFKIIDLEN